MSSANRGNFTTSFLILIPFCFSCLLLFLGLPLLCWIVVVRVGTLVFFVTLEESFYPFIIEYDVSLGLSYITFMLRCVPSMPNLSFYKALMLNSVRCFFLYWDDYMTLLFHYLNVIYNTDWFAYIQLSLHPRDKLHLIMEWSFNVLWDSVC